MYGYRKGAFTGANSDKPGLVEEAHCGTLFLDEIGELPLAGQVRLLRFLEDGEVRRLGETKYMHVDVRVIAATNRALDAEIAAGTFRSDLYFRLNVGRCWIPPLRDRLEDVDALIEFWLPRLVPRLAPRVRGFTAGALSLLRSHAWPGNVRELCGVLEVALCLASGDMVSEREVTSVLAPTTLATLDSSIDTRGKDERARLLATLEKHQWQLGRSAASLGISRSTLWRRLKKYGIRPVDYSR